MLRVDTVRVSLVSSELVRLVDETGLAGAVPLDTRGGESDDSLSGPSFGEVYHLVKV